MRSDRPRGGDEERWSALVFGVALVVALPLILWFGRDHWFFLDEWWVLTQDGLTSPGYLDAHNGHWITVLRLDYRLNFELWGLRSYLPYQVPVALAHLTAAVLVRLVMRRLGVRGWIATAAALAFLFFGSGRENMLFGFQLSLTGSVVCGLALFLLADGPRAVTRRDWLALGVGILGLMTSAAFPPFVVGIGVMTLLRRGARAAAFYVVPLGSIYAIWYAAYGRDGATPLELTGEAIRFAGRMFWATFDALAQGGVGAVLVATAGLGLATTLRRAWRSGTWADAALPLGLAVSWLAFAALTALARAELSGTYKSGRYLHVGAALLLPLVATGAEYLTRRRLLLGAAALLPLAIGLPGNLDRLSHTEWVLRGNPQFAFAMAHSPFIDDVPPDSPLMSVGEFDVPLTAGWLARQADAGRIPEPDRDDPTRDLTATSWLVFKQEARPSTSSSCPPLTRALTLTLRAGDQIEFAGVVSITATDGAHESQARGFESRNGSVIRAQAGPVDAVVRPAMGQPARVCTPRTG
ncbi:MAG: hypothetical protein ACRD07_00385 [Acidimicrobiales bacterium]